MTANNGKFSRFLCRLVGSLAIAGGLGHLALANANSNLLDQSRPENPDQTQLHKAAKQLEQFCRQLPEKESDSTSAKAPSAANDSSKAIPPRRPCENFWQSAHLIQERQDTPRLQAPGQLFAWLKSPSPTVPSSAPKAVKTDIVLPPVTAFPELNPQARIASVPIVMYHDILPTKEVSWDVTPQELEADFKLIKEQGLTPITADHLWLHLRTGVPLPEKPVLLSFDDGYGGHYQYVFPLLKKYNFPAVFSIYVNKMTLKGGRTSVTWEQLKEMTASPLVTIASHTVSHPKDLRELDDDRLAEEVLASKQILEEKLGIPLHYFTYPEGKHDARIKQWAVAAGYRLAFAMDDAQEGYAGESPDLLAIKRFGQSSLETAIAKAWGGFSAPVPANQFDFNSPVQKQEFIVDGQKTSLVWGGQPKTFHATSRYQVGEILAGTGAVAGVDGTFFSLKLLTSDVLIGPVFSSNRGFIPGNDGENQKLTGRPLALISADSVRFIPFDPDRHNSLAGIQAASRDGGWISDAFVAGAWLVRDNQPRPAETFNGLFGFDAERNRAFWGINQAGQPVLGATNTLVDSVTLGKILAKLGFRDAIMLDSGASTSLVYYGQSQVQFTPRPTPHVVALYPPVYPQAPEPVLMRKVATKP